MGRFPAGDARLHELRQPKPNNAAFRQSRPPRSRGSSLGPEHPQRAIRPACQEGPPWTLALPSRLPCPQRSGSRNRLGGSGTTEAAKGRAPRLLPLEPHRPHARSSAAGLLPGTRRCAPHARHPHRIPGGIGSSPAIRWGCRPSRAFANPALRTASRAYRQTSRARRPCIGGRSGKPRQKPTASQGSAEAFARTEDLRRQIAASMPHASGPINRCPRPHLSKRPRKRPWDGQLRRRKCTKRNAAPKAPQERRRGCTRTPRRRRRSG